MDSTLAEVMEESAALDLFKRIAPDMADSPMLAMAKQGKIGVLCASVPDNQKRIFKALLEAANGRKVDLTPFAQDEPPQVFVMFEAKYNLDDVDGRMYMLDRRFSGCVILRFSKQMDESVYGRITCGGTELPRGCLKSMDMAGGIQMLGVPVRGVFTEYDTSYTLRVEGFQDIRGNLMESAELTIHTLPMSGPDPRYAANDDVALQAAREGMVLLKNRNNTLPLKAGSAVHITGGETFRLGAVGAGRINPRYSVGLLRAVKEYSDFRLAEKTDTAIVVISRGSGENLDGAAIPGEFYLSSDEETILAEARTRYQKLIAILNSGYPMDVRWVETCPVDALIWCGYPGMLGGRALVEILDGRINPSGKLPDTWSLDYYDIPSSANFYNAVEGKPALSTDVPVWVDTYYEEDIYVGYRYFESFQKPVAYPFGFGLSYTDFSITAHSSGLKVTALVKNSGKAAGMEMVQVYAKVPSGKLEQPAKRLVAFAKTRLLEPGEEEALELEIGKKSLASYNTESACWILEKGRYVLFAGDSVQNAVPCGEWVVEAEETLQQVRNRLVPPVHIDTLSQKNPSFPKGARSGVKENAAALSPKAVRAHYDDKDDVQDFVGRLSVEELARLSVCASHGWGMHELGEAGRIFRLESYDIPAFVVADGNNAVNVNRPNIGMPVSAVVCATFNRDLAYRIGRTIAEEARDNGIDLILGPGMNIHRNPLNGRHCECFSEDPYLAGIMAGHQSKGLEDGGVSSCLKHVAANNCESSRKRNHSIVSERALREIYLKAFEVALDVHRSDSIMTAYNALNGVFTAEDEELLLGVFREEFGFDGFIMTDWNSYDTVDVAAAVQAGNCWMTPGTTDNTYVKPIVDGVRDGKISLSRLRNNVRYLLRVVQRRTGKDLGVGEVNV
jgi:beta-glucosidase